MGAGAVENGGETDIGHRWCLLSPVLREGGCLAGVEAGEVCPHAAGFDRGVLGGVADGAHGGASGFDVADQCCVGTVAERGCLIDDHHTPGVEQFRVVFEAAKEACDGGRWDAGGGLQHLSRSAVHRCPEKGVAVGFPGAGGDFEGGGLA